MPWDDGVDWYPTGEYDPSYDPYEEGYNNGDSDGSTGSPTNPNDPAYNDFGSIDWGSIEKALGLAAGTLKPGGSNGGSGGLTDILKALGLTTGNNGGLGALLPLLSLFAGGLGLNNQNNNTKEAAAELKAGADKANQYATDLIGGARGAFTPYQDAGASAVGQLSGMVGANDLAGKFGPITGPGDLGSKFKGTMTLKQLMGK